MSRTMFDKLGPQGQLNDSAIQIHVRVVTPLYLVPNFCMRIDRRKFSV